MITETSLKHPKVIKRIKREEECQEKEKPYMV